MPAPLFHRKAGDDGVQELKLVHDPSRGSLILRVGSGRKQKDARLPKVDPLEKARTVLGNAIPEDLVDIISRWNPALDEVRRGCPHDDVNSQHLTVLGPRVCRMYLYPD